MMPQPVTDGPNDSDPRHRAATEGQHCPLPRVRPSGLHEGDGGEQHHPERRKGRMVLVYNANYELVLVPATTAEILPERDERAMGGSGLEEHPGVTTAPQPVQHVQCSTSAIATSQYWTDRGAEPALAHLLAQAGVRESAATGAEPIPGSLDGFIATPHAGLRNDPEVVDAHRRAVEAKLASARALASARQAALESRMEKQRPEPARAEAASGQLSGGVTAREDHNTHPPKRPITMVVNALATGPATSVPRTTAQQTEQIAKEKQAGLLAILIGSDQVALACGYRLEEGRARQPKKMQALWLKHITAYSVGQIQSGRCALNRLSRWLESEGLLEACAGWNASGGLLSEWVLDEKSASTSVGDSIPGSLRDNVRWAAKALKLGGLAVDDEAFKNVAVPPGRQPTPALAATPAMLFHFAALACSHQRPIVRHYAAGFVLVLLAALRIRDAQRAHIAVHDAPVSGASVEGVCYTSKHPRRRAPQPMPFWVPPSSKLLGDWQRGLQFQGPDYIFPAVGVPRGSKDSIADQRAAVQLGPARSRYVIKHMRALLRMGEFMTEAQAKRFSGHSGRHTLVTIARLLGYEHEDRRELGRWLAALGDEKERRAAMANAYSSEAERPRVLDVIGRVLSDIKRLVTSPSALSLDDPWAPFRAQREAASSSTGGETIAGEASSSESDASDVET